MTLTLREFVRQCAHTEHIISPVHLPESKTVAAAIKIASNDTVRIPPSADLDTLRAELRLAAQNNSFDRLSRLDWRHSPFALEGKDGIIDQPELMQKYLNALVSHATSRTLRGLAGTYVKTFRSNHASTALLGRFFTVNVSNISDAWRRAHETCALFYPDLVVDRLVALLKKRSSPECGMSHVFQQEGFPANLAHSQLALEVLQKLLASMTQKNTTLTDIRQAKTIMALTTDGKGELALAGSSGVVEAMTSALLLPFRSISPAAQLRTEIERHLLHHLKDPRLHAEKWGWVHTEAKQVILNWLTEQSLDLFLDIVQRVVDTASDAKRMWKEREKLWRNYLKAGHIDEAWVVLGRDGVTYAREVNAEAHKTILTYGTLTHSTDTAKHVALIMRIDTLRVVDWSHNGKCHIWLGDNTAAPKLYESYYGKYKMEKDSDVAFTHDASGAWIDKVRSVIYQNTGR